MLERRWITLNSEYDAEQAESAIRDLGESLNKLGIKLEIRDTSARKELVISYDKEILKQKESRGAGAPRKAPNALISAEQIRERMQNGETAEQIAASLGISRASFFRKLKAAEEWGMPFL